MAGSYRSPARVEITLQDVRARFRYDESGDLYWRISPGPNRAAGDRAYTVSKGRKTIRIGSRRLPQSHVVWFYFKGYWPAAELDHRDRDSMNDRLGNLREASPQKNCMNQGARRCSKTGIKGVWKHSQRAGFWAKISADGFRYDLGVYPTAELAAGAYRIAAAGMHGEFAGA